MNAAERALSRELRWRRPRQIAWLMLGIAYGWLLRDLTD